MDPVWHKISSRLRLARRVAVEMLYGMSTLGWASEVQRERQQAGRLFLLLAFGGLLGLPIPSSYYALRVLPHVALTIGRWKRGLLRERDWSDLAGQLDGLD